MRSYLAAKWRQWRWQMEFYHTPLELRYSYRILNRLYSYPLFRLLLLFLRLPRFFPCRLPPAPREIMAYEPEAYMNEQHPDIYELRLIPVWRWRDTIQRSFYRLYEAVCAYDEPLIGYETEYMWKRTTGAGWGLEKLRDPRDDGCDNEEQFAVFASLVEALADAFNWRLSLGLRPDGELIETAAHDEENAVVANNDTNTNANTSTERNTTRAKGRRTKPGNRDTRNQTDSGDSSSNFVPHVPPDWTVSAPRLETRLLLHDYGDSSMTGSGESFDRRNIQASAAALRTV